MNVLISYQGMEVSDALNSYLNEKLAKYEEFLNKATSISSEFIQNVSSKGVKNDFRLEINVVVPNALIRVEEKGEDMYAIIDKATDVLARRIKRYLDKQTTWEGVTPWSDLEASENFKDVEQEEVQDDYIGYTPKVSVRKPMESMAPMAEAEAIERMELLGDMQILFKNSKTGKLSMIYKNRSGQYCLVEPQEVL